MSPESPRLGCSAPGRRPPDPPGGDPGPTDGGVRNPCPGRAPGARLCPIRGEPHPGPRPSARPDHLAPLAARCAAVLEATFPPARSSRSASEIRGPRSDRSRGLPEDPVRRFARPPCRPRRVPSRIRPSRSRPDHSRDRERETRATRACAPGAARRYCRAVSAPRSQCSSG